MRWLALAILLVPAAAQAHGSVSERIDALSRALHERPNDAALYADRGSLHALEGEWTEAVRDLEDAYELDPRLAGIEHRLANALLHIGESERAIELLSQLLRRVPKHFDARVVRARAYLAIGEVDEAVHDYDIAIASTKRPAPRYYRERAKALAAEGRHDEAIAGLRQGIDRLGPLVSLVEPAIDYEIARGRRARALELAGMLAPALRDSAEWRARRAGWLAADGRIAEAHEQYRLALDTLGALPESRRRTAAMNELEVRIRREVAALGPERPRGRSEPLWLALLVACALLALLRHRWRRRAHFTQMGLVNANGRAPER